MEQRIFCQFPAAGLMATASCSLRRETGLLSAHASQQVLQALCPLILSQTDCFNPKSLVQPV